MDNKLNLPALWSSPDNARHTKNQYSFRLPVHVAAKIEALCEMYPQRTRTEIVGDLLSSALTSVEKAFPSVKGKPFGSDPANGEMLYEDAGPAMRFRQLSNKRFAALEKELGNEKPNPLYRDTVYVVHESDFEK